MAWTVNIEGSEARNCAVPGLSPSGIGLDRSDLIFYQFVIKFFIKATAKYDIIHYHE